MMLLHFGPAVFPNLAEQVLSAPVKEKALLHHLDLGASKTDVLGIRGLYSEPELPS
jgi:hypothetical protein